MASAAAWSFCASAAAASAVAAASARYPRGGPIPAGRGAWRRRGSLRAPPRAPPRLGGPARLGPVGARLGGGDRGGAAPLPVGGRGCEPESFGAGRDRRVYGAREGRLLGRWKAAERRRDSGAAQPRGAGGGGGAGPQR